MVAKKSEAAKPKGKAIEILAAPYLKRIESLEDEIASITGKNMAECKALREDQKEIYIEARDAGVPKKALAGLVKWRELEKKQIAIQASLDDLDDAAVYDKLVETLGDLGMAAARKAGFTELKQNAKEAAKAEAERKKKADAKAKRDAKAGKAAAEPPRGDDDLLERVGRGKNPAQQKAEDEQTDHVAESADFNPSEEQQAAPALN